MYGDALTNGIFGAELISHVPLIIEDGLMTSKITPSEYYVSIMQGLSHSKQHRSYIIRNPEKTPVKTEIDGTLLYLNKNATEWEILAIVGSKPKRVSSIISELEELFVDKNRAQKRISFENYGEQLIAKENTEVILRKPYINLSKYSCIEFNYNVGDSVKAGYSIGDIEHMEFSEKAQKCSARYAMAYEHCTIKLHELKIELSKSTVNVLEKKDKNGKISLMKKQCFKDIWTEDNKAKYDQVIDSILNITLDSGKAIIFRKGSKLEWSVEPAKGSQMYLAAFFYECEDANLLDIDKYEGRIPVIMDILKRTFKIDCSTDAFHTIKNDNADFYKEYKKEFRKIAKKITQ